MRLESGADSFSPERDLKHGDEFHLTKSAIGAFRVDITNPPRCSACSVILPQDHASRERLPGVFLCRTCQLRATASEPSADVPSSVPHAPDTCFRCHRPSPGTSICTDCRRDMAGLADALVAQAPANPDLAAICGYQIKGMLGKGGKGAVYLAHHAATGKSVALKVMLPDHAADQHAIRRFLDEMKFLGSLRHRHIVRLLDTGSSHGIFFLTLEHCDAGSVTNLLKQRGGSLPTDEAVEITLQALAGLHHAHTAVPGGPVVHRDLKPGNLLLCGSGSSRMVKVADFGLAKALDSARLSSTATDARGGTSFFMPRQQVIRFKAVNPAVDVWAMAATLYCMLTGVVPRDFPEKKDRWLVVLEHPPVPIRQRLASVPAKLAEVIDHALQEKPDICFATAAAFKEALEDVV